MNADEVFEGKKKNLPKPICAAGKPAAATDEQQLSLELEGQCLVCAKGGFQVNAAQHAGAQSTAVASVCCSAGTLFVKLVETGQNNRIQV